MTLPLILDILFVLIAVTMVAAYAKKGLIKSLISSCKLLLSFVLTYLLGGKVAALLQSSLIGKPVYDFVYGKVDGLHQSLGSAINAEEIAGSFPEFLMTEEVRASIANATSEESGQAMVESVTNGIANPVASLISNVIGYVLTFVVALIVLSLLAKLLTAIVDRIRLFGAVNHILGGVWGALVGVIILFVAASVTKFFLGADEYAATVVVRFFGDSALLETFKFLNIGASWFAELMA